jgi:hypothetical protein
MIVRTIEINKPIYTSKANSTVVDHIKFDALIQFGKEKYNVPSELSGSAINYKELYI